MFARSLLYQHLRAHDYENYIAALLAPPSQREAVMALFAFAEEIRRIPETVSETMIGHIKLAWWREQIEALSAGKPIPSQFILDVLKIPMADGKITQAQCDRLLAAESDRLEAYPFSRLEDLERWARQVGDVIAEMLAAVQAVTANEAARRAVETALLLAAAEPPTAPLALDAFDAARRIFEKNSRNRELPEDAVSRFLARKNSWKLAARISRNGRRTIHFLPLRALFYRH